MVSALKFLVFNILVQDFSPKLGLAFLQDLVFLQDLAFLQDLELLFFKRASRPTHEQPPPAVGVHQMQQFCQNMYFYPKVIFNTKSDQMLPKVEFLTKSEKI